MSRGSQGGIGLGLQCHAMGWITVPEYVFAPPRRWRFDLAMPPWRLAVEVEGGTFMVGGSRHSRGAGYEKDCEKYAEALIRGWRVLRVTTGMVNDGRALGYIERAIERLRHERMCP